MLISYIAGMGTNNICERMQRTIKTLQKNLGIRTDRVVAGLHDRLIETVAEDARLDQNLDESQSSRRQERIGNGFYLVAFYFSIKLFLGGQLLIAVNYGRFHNNHFRRC